MPLSFLLPPGCYILDDIALIIPYSKIRRGSHYHYVATERKGRKIGWKDVIKVQERASVVCALDNGLLVIEDVVYYSTLSLPAISLTEDGHNCPDQSQT